VYKLVVPNTIVIGREENKYCYSNSKFISYGSRIEEISHNIFSILRSVDKLNPDLIIIEGVERKGLGLAVMNRLIRSCDYNYKEV
jgi:L-threonylcarbamoyladenylate synthase